MGYCEKHNGYNPLGGCSLCYLEEQTVKANQHARYKRALELTAQWFEIHMKEFQEFDIYTEIISALKYDGQDITYLQTKEGR